MTTYINLNGSAVGAGTTFTGGTVANATTFSSNVDIDGDLTLGSISSVTNELNKFTNISSGIEAIHSGSNIGMGSDVLQNLSTGTLNTGFGEHALL